MPLTSSSEIDSSRLQTIPQINQILMTNERDNFRDAQRGIQQGHLPEYGGYVGLRSFGQARFRGVQDTLE